MLPLMSKPDLISLKRTMEAVLAVDALDTMGRVDVLDHSDLIASSAALAGDDGGIGQEEFPDL